MVRKGDLRIRKYEGKVDPTVISSRYEKLKGMMVEQATTKFSDLASLEDEIKTKVLEPGGVPTIQIPFYLNFAREIYKKSSAFSGKTLSNEIGLIMNKWMARGLDKAILEEVARIAGVPATS